MKDYPSTWTAVPQALRLPCCNRNQKVPVICTSNLGPIDIRFWVICGYVVSQTEKHHVITDYPESDVCARTTPEFI